MAIEALVLNPRFAKFGAVLARIQTGEQSLQPFGLILLHPKTFISPRPATQMLFRDVCMLRS